MPEPGEKPTCFIAMPITTQLDDIPRYGDDKHHWRHVMGSLFEDAIERAGFEPIRPNAVGANLIHGEIIRHLSTADLVLVDLSTHNPNVFFELGVRTSINRPIALVRDELTNLPFDISGINTYEYDSKMPLWEAERQRDTLAQHIKDSYASCGGQNPLWRQFGLTITASEPHANESPLDAKVDLLVSQIKQMQLSLDPANLATNDVMTQGSAATYWDQAPQVTVIRAPEMRKGQLEMFVRELTELLLTRYPKSATSSEVTRLRENSGSLEFYVDVFLGPNDMDHIHRIANQFNVRVEISHVARRFAESLPHDRAHRTSTGTDGRRVV